MADGVRDTKKRGGWRYQPVWVGDGDDCVVTLCECYFDADGKLAAWTENSSMHPQGETVEELASDLSLMLSAVYKWKPVAFHLLRPGMTFQRTGVNVEGMIAAMNMARSSMA